MAAQHCTSMSRLRKYRKSANLTQREVATLVGYASQRAYSDVELGIKRPALGPAIACTVLFNTSLDCLFPTLAGSIEQGLLARARKLHGDLERAGGRKETAPAISEIINRLGDAEARP
jgi:transcriptional regulator with XRE-family HTH domain